jgi:hypothetical protein
MSKKQHKFFKGIHPDPQNNLFKDIEMHPRVGITKGSTESGQLIIKFKFPKRIGQVVKYFNLDTFTVWNLEGITENEYDEMKIKIELEIEDIDKKRKKLQMIETKLE